MKLIAFPLVGVATLVGVFAFTAPAANQESAAVFVTNIPLGYRDWRLISVAHEEGNLHSFAAVLGNELALQKRGEQSVGLYVARQLCGLLPSGTSGSYA